MENNVEVERLEENNTEVIVDKNEEILETEFDSNKVIELNILDVTNMFETMKEGYNVLAELLHARLLILNDLAPYVEQKKFISMATKGNGLVVNVTDALDRLDALTISIDELKAEYDSYVDTVADESKTELEKDKAMAMSIDRFNLITKQLEELNAELENLTEVYTIFVQNDIDLELRNTAKARDLLLDNKEKLESEFKDEVDGK